MSEARAETRFEAREFLGRGDGPYLEMQRKATAALASGNDVTISMLGGHCIIGMAGMTRPWSDSYGYTYATVQDAMSHRNGKRARR